MSANIDSTVPLILAGGRGTRISQLFPSLPKPAVPVRGRPFLVLIPEQLAKSGFGKVVISGGYLFDILQKNIQPHIPPNMEVVWVREREPMGTGGGLLYAVRHSGLSPQNWMVMNGDSYLSGKWVEIMKERNPSEAWIVARKVPDSGRYGRLEVYRSRLVAFQEKNAGGGGCD
jgi:D-glycero-alpha-D-manno-heptose 1-phosphate guanylyltransferase